MALRAKVGSLDALESFRARLIVYTNQARAALEEVSADVMRTRLWLQTEQRVSWERELRRRLRTLEEAQQALFSSRLSSLRHESAAEQMAVHRAKRAVEEGEAKLRVLRTWDRDFDSRVQPLVKQIEKLHTVLTHDMVQAVAFLTDAINTLAAYAGIAAPSVQAGLGEAGVSGAPGAAGSGANAADSGGKGQT